MAVTETAQKLIGCTTWDEPVFADLIGHVERGEIKPLLAKTLPLQEIAVAQREFLEKRPVGKFAPISPGRPAAEPASVSTDRRTARDDRRGRAGLWLGMAGATSMDGAVQAERDATGAWRPPELIETPAVFVWPPNPAGFLKWLFGYNGYLWPWNIIYVAMAVAAWRWLTPDLQSMRSLEPGWIALILARNAIIVFLVVGAWHWRLYIRRAQGMAFKYNGRWQATNNGSFLFRDQVLDNLFRTFASAVPVWTGYEVITLWGQANGWFPYASWRDHPIYCGLFMLLIPLILEVHFYIIHRLIHWPPLYRRVHYIHHKNANPGPWSGLAMHPVEHVLYFSSALIHWIVPSHPLHVIFNLQFLAVYPAQDHSGFNRVVLSRRLSVPTGDRMHYLHHKLFEVNYGSTGTIPIDRWMGTLHDGSVAADARLQQRLRDRRARPA